MHKSIRQLHALDRTTVCDLSVLVHENIDPCALMLILLSLDSHAKALPCLLGPLESADRTQSHHLDLQFLAKLNPRLPDSRSPVSRVNLRILVVSPHSTSTSFSFMMAMYRTSPPRSYLRNTPDVDAATILSTPGCTPMFSVTSMCIVQGDASTHGAPPCNRSHLMLVLEIFPCAGHITVIGFR